MLSNIDLGRRVAVKGFLIGVAELKMSYLSSWYYASCELFKLAALFIRPFIKYTSQLSWTSEISNLGFISLAEAYLMMVLLDSCFTIVL